MREGRAGAGQAVAGAYAGWDPARAYADVGWLMADLGVYRCGKGERGKESEGAIGGTAWRV